jgi:hypothetical protein
LNPKLSFEVLKTSFYALESILEVEFGKKVVGKLSLFFFTPEKLPDLLPTVAVCFFCSPEVARVSWPMTVDDGRQRRLGVGGIGCCIGSGWGKLLPCFAYIETFCNFLKYMRCQMLNELHKS